MKVILIWQCLPQWSESKEAVQQPLTVPKSWTMFPSIWEMQVARKKAAHDLFTISPLNCVHPFSHLYKHILTSTSGFQVKHSQVLEQFKNQSWHLSQITVCSAFLIQFLFWLLMRRHWKGKGKLLNNQSKMFITNCLKAWWASILISTGLEKAQSRNWTFILQLESWIITASQIPWGAALQLYHSLSRKVI